MSDNTFNATWDAPLIPNGRIRHYRVYYSVDRTDPISRWHVAYAGNTWKIIRRLIKHEVYYFKVQVVGYAGIGPMSEDIGVVRAQEGGMFIYSIFLRFNVKMFQRDGQERITRS